MSKIGQFMREVRRAKYPDPAFSITKIAEHLGFCKAYIMQIETDKRPVTSLDFIRRWAEFMGVTQHLPLLYSWFVMESGSIELDLPADSPQEKVRLGFDLLNHWGNLSPEACRMISEAIKADAS